MASLPSWVLQICEEKEVRCLECGECCRQFSWHLRASTRDLRRWREAGREDLLQRVNRLGWIWVDPKTKQRLPVCPFLVETAPNRTIRGIHEIKPDICRAYPTAEHYHTCLRGTFLGDSLLRDGVRAGAILLAACLRSPPLRRPFLRETILNLTYLLDSHLEDAFLLSRILN